MLRLKFSPSLILSYTELYYYLLWSIHLFSIIHGYTQSSYKSLISPMGGTIYHRTLLSLEIIYYCSFYRIFVLHHPATVWYGSRRSRDRKIQVKWSLLHLLHHSKSYLNSKCAKVAILMGTELADSENTLIQNL